MNMLMKSLAPLPDAAWREIEADAREALTEHMVARRVVDFDGPHSLRLGAVNMGAIQRVEIGEGVAGGLREVQPVLEVRVPFTLMRSSIDDAARGAPDFDTAPAVQAARRLAEIEDRAVFHGLEPARIKGLGQVSPHPVLSLGTDPLNFADVITRAMLTLDDAAIAGPYALLLGSTPYRRLAGITSSYPPLQHIAKLLGCPVLHSPVLDGGLLLSLRGGDFVLSVGQDATIGYTRHDAERVELFFIESFTFLAVSPEAVVRLAL